MVWLRMLVPISDSQTVVVVKAAAYKRPRMKAQRFKIVFVLFLTKQKGFKSLKNENISTCFYVLLF